MTGIDLSIVLLWTLCFISLIDKQAFSDDLNYGKESALKRQATGDHCMSSGGFLLAADSSDTELNLSEEVDAKLSDILNRNGPDMRPASDYTDFNDINLKVAKRAWSLMHNHVHKATKVKLEAFKPVLVEILSSANVSLECHKASLATIEAAMRFESWALQLISAWGNFPPVGIYEGTFGDIGSFHGCLAVPENSKIRHAHYCSLAFKPVLVTREPYESIFVKEPKEMLDMFEEKNLTTGLMDHLNKQQDAFTSILANSQYNHFVYYKLGTCFPIDCSPIDVQRVAKLLARRTILMSGPVKCSSRFATDYEQIVELIPSINENSSKLTNATSTSPIRKQLEISIRDLNEGVYIWKPHWTRSQLVAFSVLLSISGLILIFTFLDIIINIAPKLSLIISNDNTNDSSVVHTNKVVEPRSDDHQSKTIMITGSIHKLKLKQEDNTIVVDGLEEEEDDDDDDDDEKFAENMKNKKSLVSDANNNRFELDNLMLADKLDKDNQNYQDHQRVKEISFHSHIYDDKQKEYHELDNQDTCRHSLDQGFSIDMEGKDKRAHEMITKKKMKKSQLPSNQQIESSTSKFSSSSIKLATNQRKSLFMQIIDDFSIIRNTGEYFTISQGQLKNDILCINGIRCLTMSWIILAHTMQYNDWSAFARIREVESHLKSLVNQPIFNGTYLVDTFFLLSGILVSFTTFKRKFKRDGSCQELLENFSVTSYLTSRYLRLTPQILFVSLLFILLPKLNSNGSPHWYTMTGEYSENCQENWWINLLHIQAFYKPERMCNFVCWWISVDMFFHLFALLLILLVYFKGVKYFGTTVGLTIFSYIVAQAIKHYQLNLPPNLLSTIPQTGLMWTKMTIQFFWSPIAHCFPFFYGFYLGYLMAQHSEKLKNWFNPRKAILGWILAIATLGGVLYSTHFWITNQLGYNQAISTIFYVICPILWSLSLSYIIVACHYGYGGSINSLLSCKLFLILGKASYLVYLSHFIVVYSFFGSQNLLMEPTQQVMLYVIFGNVVFSMLFGSALCIFFETPWLKTQKRIMKYIN